MSSTNYNINTSKYLDSEIKTDIRSITPQNQSPVFNQTVIHNNDSRNINNDSRNINFVKS